MNNFYGLDLYKEKAPDGELPRYFQYFAYVV